MKRFGYWRDPLTLTAILLYGLNRWWWKPHLPSGFWHDHFNDLLLVPAALPLVLLAQRGLRWREHDDPPSWSEIALHLVIWTVVAEVLAPRWLAHATGDWRDALAYLSGGLVAGVFWQGRFRLRSRRAAARELG